MKKFIFLLILVFQVLTLSAQKKSGDKYSKIINPDYITFVEYFNNQNLGEPNLDVELIPPSLFQCVIGYQCAYDKKSLELIDSIIPLQILNDEYNTTLVYKIIKSHMGKPGDYHLVTFSDEGIIKKSKNIGVSDITSIIRETCEVNFYNNKLLETIQMVKINRKGKEVVREIERTYYLITKKGFSKFYPEYTYGRKFPVGSTQILKAEDITIYTSGQLDIIKNEIFAEYGLNFTDNIWKEYFANQNWYIPSANQVDSLLTDIEKINVQRVMNISE